MSGKGISRKPDSIISEVKSLVKGGRKEITLLARMLTATEQRKDWFHFLNFSI
jgi:tRNA A37 methylthiotransferase MiaB